MALLNLTLDVVLSLVAGLTIFWLSRIFLKRKFDNFYEAYGLSSSFLNWLYAFYMVIFFSLMILTISMLSLMTCRGECYYLLIFYPFWQFAPFIVAAFLGLIIILLLKDGYFMTFVRSVPKIYYHAILGTLFLWAILSGTDFLEILLGLRGNWLYEAINALHYKFYWPFIELISANYHHIIAIMIVFYLFLLLFFMIKIPSNYLPHYVIILVTLLIVNTFFLSEGAEFLYYVGIPYIFSLIILVPLREFQTKKLLMVFGALIVLILLFFMPTLISHFTQFRDAASEDSITVKFICPACDNPENLNYAFYKICSRNYFSNLMPEKVQPNYYRQNGLERCDTGEDCYSVMCLMENTGGTATTRFGLYSSILDWPQGSVQSLRFNNFTTKDDCTEYCIHEMNSVNDFNTEMEQTQLTGIIDDYAVYFGTIDSNNPVKNCACELFITETE
ncbi:hypothetical protein J4227_04445 [Candidatus Woesearchaeota archaeon]|nr:hypothetical protein [Candidatus Woesearchaeota archaeon]